MLIGAGSLLGAHFLLIEIQAGAPNNVSTVFCY